MQPPSVQYVTTSDSKRIAYGVSGNGPPLVFLPGVFYHVHLAWQYPGLLEWMEALADRFQLIQIDIRGTGMSSRDLGDDHAGADYQRDLEAVFDRLKLERFFVLAAARGVDIAVDYVLQHPGRVEALLFGTSGAGPAPAVFEMLPAQDWEVFLHNLVPRDRSREDAKRIVDLMKQGSDPRNFILRWRALGPNGDIGERLSRLNTPTLVMHARDYVLTHVEEGMKVAQFSGGRLVLLDGSDPWGDADQGMRAIESFLADLAPRTKIQQTDGLSSREIEVLRLIAAGKSNQQIADELVISHFTVQRHVGHIFTKTGLANRTEAAIYARDNGLA